MKLPADITSLIRNRKFLYSLAAVAALLLLWRLFAVFTFVPVSEKEVPLVRAVTVGEEAGASVNIYAGEIRGEKESVLSFQTKGRITSRLVKVGDKVEKDQLLFTLDPRDAANLTAAADAAVASAAASQKVAAENVRRYAALLKAGAVSQAVYDSYSLQLDTANARLEEARALASASRDQLAYTELKSDMQGEIASIGAETGQVVAAGTPIVTVVTGAALEAQFYLPEKDLQGVAAGAPCSVELWALPGSPLQGTVKEIAAAADSVTRTYRVRASLKEVPQEVKVGMTCKVSLPKPGLPSRQTYLLPLGALYQVNGKKAVWLIEEGKARLREVECEEYRGAKIAVTAGLKAGDTVITAGVEKLSEGQAVRPARPPKAGE